MQLRRTASLYCESRARAHIERGYRETESLVFSPDD